MISNKSVVVALPQTVEERAVAAVLSSIGISVLYATTGREAIMLLEDEPAVGLITTVQLADMHAWSLVRDLQEIGVLSRIQVYVLSDASLVSTLSTLPNVNLIVRPVARMQLENQFAQAFGVTR